MWNIAICDDEPEILKSVASKLQQCKNTQPQLSDIGAVAAYCDGQVLIEEIEDGKIEADIIVMDIKLKADNGIELAERVLRTRPDCQIIFMSGYDDYYEAVYDVDHIYFLQKPVSDTALTKALQRAVEKLNNLEKACFHMENKSGRFVIPYSRIYYFEKQKRQVLVRGSSGQVLCSFYGKFEEMEALPRNFLRCHNSMIVNMGRVSAVGKSSFRLIDGSFVPISRTYLQQSRLGFARYCMPDVRG